MAQKPDGKSAKTEQVSFTRPAAERIAKVVRTVEAGRRDCRPLKIHGMPQQGTSKIFRVATFTGAWAVDTSRAVTFRNVTATPNTVSVVNLFYNFTQTSGTATCAIAKDGTAWYLVAPNPAAVASQQTAQATVITGVSLGTAGLQFTTMDIKFLETVSTSVVTIGTTACTT